MAIYITINKTLNTHDLVKKTIYADGTHDYAVCYCDKYYY